MRLALLLAGAAVVLLPELDTAPIERAEIYFLDGARAMVERGDYVVPHYRGKPFFDKPPLTHWLMAASFHVFGFTPGAARLVPAAATLGVLLATVWLGALLLDRSSALLGAVMLASSVITLSFGRVAMSDMLLTLWSTLAVCVALRACAPSPPAWASPALGALLGLGFLTKGPVAVILPGLGLLLLLWRHRRDPLPAPSAGLVLAALLFMVFGLGWFLLLYLRLGAGPLVHFFFQENLQRFAGERYDTGQEPWFYLPAYLAVGLPWSLFLPAAISCYLREELVGHPGLGGSRFLAAWMGLMAIPLSLSRGKLDYYLLPLLPAASLVIGHYFASVPWGRFERVWARGALAIAGALLALVAVAPAGLPAEWLPGPAARLALSAAAAIGCAACVLAAVRVSPARTASVLAGTTSALFLGLVTLFLPAFRRAQPNAAILDDVSRERRYRPDAGVVACEDPTRVQRDILFHTRVAVSERCDLWNPASSKHAFMMLLQREERLSLQNVPRFRVIREYRYLPAEALTLKGLLGLAHPDSVFLAANYNTQDPVAKARRRQERRARWAERERRAKEGDRSERDE